MVLSAYEVLLVKGVIRFEVSGQLYFGGGAVGVTRFRQSNAQTVVDRRSSGNESGGSAERRHSLVILPLSEIIAAQLIMGRGHIRLESKHMLQLRDGFVKAA